VKKDLLEKLKKIQDKKVKLLIEENEIVYSISEENGGGGQVPPPKKPKG